MSENGNKEPTPTFDFSNVSRQWQLDLGRSLSQAARAGIILQRQPNDDMDYEEFEALLDRQEQAVNELESLADQQAQLVTRVLAAVPTTWLLPNAPPDLDWSKVESLDYIQADRYAEILELLRTRDSAGENSKNSHGHSRSRSKRRGR